MTTVPTTAPDAAIFLEDVAARLVLKRAANLGHALPIEAALDGLDWEERYEQDPFCRSVLASSDEDTLELNETDLIRILRSHQVPLEKYLFSIWARKVTGGRVLPARHAGQLLHWLGY